MCTKHFNARCIDAEDDPSKRKGAMKALAAYHRRAERARKEAIDARERAFMLKAGLKAADLVFDPDAESSDEVYKKRSKKLKVSEQQRCHCGEQLGGKSFICEECAVMTCNVQKCISVHQQECSSK
jgi:hypothetical protein